MPRFSVFLALLLLQLTVPDVNADERPPGVEAVKAGVTLKLFAEHPQVVTPTGIDVDEQGRIWVVASHTHFPPEDYAGPKYDEILVFDPQGQRSVFYNATHHTMDLELGADGWVYLAERSRILRIKDSDHDGSADVAEELIVMETEADYPHNGLSGLAWDVNGDLIVCLGENYSKPYTMTGADKTVYIGSSEGGVFRIKPDGTGLTRIARGLWNPFGICVREDGEMFAVDNDPGELPPCRLLNIVQGADYGFQRKYGSEAQHPFVCWNGELRNTLPMVIPVGEAPCGIVPFGNGLLSPSWGDHHICFYSLREKGAGFDATPVILAKGKRYFRPACLARNRAEDRPNVQSWYVTDWVDGRYNVHGYGRIWKLEIDTTRADWVNTREHVGHAGGDALLARQLRHNEHSLIIGEILEQTHNDDPYLSQAAITALSYQAKGWTIADVKDRAVNDQVNMLLAIKQAAQANDSGIEVQSWIDCFLANEDTAIQFETLRWIADFELKENLPAIETILARSELDFALFEAAMATWNTLTGNGEAGVRNEELLLKRVLDTSSSPQIRAFALRLLPAQIKMANDAEGNIQAKFPKGLTKELFRNLIAIGDADLTLEAIRTLGTNPTVGQQILVAMARNENESVVNRSEAIACLDTSSDEIVEVLLVLSVDPQRAIREEAIRTLRGVELTGDQQKRLADVGKQFAESADLVTAVIDPKQLTLNRPDLADVAGWKRRLDTLPGKSDVEAGRRLFYHSKMTACTRCHRYNGRGNTVGPDLSSVGTRNDGRWLLESILQPSKEMSPEFRPSTVVLNDGRTFTGIRLQSYTAEAIRDQNGLKQVFNKDDVDEVIDLETSFMPSGLAHTMTDRELRDLIAFLSQKAN